MGLHAFSQQPAIDVGTYRGLIEVLGDEVIAIMIEFLERTPEQLRELRVAAARSDIKRIEELSHQLKSASGNLGISAFSSVCRFLEESARTRTPINTDEMLTALESEFTRAVKELETLQ